MRVSLILAVAENGVIGRDGALPWRLRTDMRRFRELTMGKPLVMGRRQYDSVGKPLPGRDNIIVTRTADFAAPGCLTAATIETALAQAEACARQRGVDEIMVIGGAEIYRLLLPRADRIYLSRVHATPAGDVIIDLGDLSGWVESERQEVPAGPRDDWAHTFSVLDRPAGRPVAAQRGG